MFIYVLLTSTTLHCRSPLPGTSLLVGELFVLLIRILMPVHVICSVLQATSLSKVLMGASNSTVVEVRWGMYILLCIV